MIEQLKQELAAIAETVGRYGKVNAMLESLQAEEQCLAQQEAALCAVLNKENADVARLERTSASAIIYSLLGQKEQQLEKEQQEAYAAKLKYDAVVRRVDDCHGRIDALLRERDALAGCEEQYNRVFQQLQQELRNDPQYAGRFCALEKSLGENAAQIREIEEAQDAGRAAMAQIQKIERNLNSAEGWGTWDLLGGGLVSDMVKHSHLDEAQEEAEELQMLLSRFHTELADVQVTADMEQISVDGFLGFADFFFDGLIADWSVLSHIHESQDSVARVKNQVAMALDSLDRATNARRDEKTRLKNALSELVRNA